MPLDRGLTPNGPVVRRVLGVVTVALAGLIALSLLSAQYGREFVLAVDSANAAARAELHDRARHYKPAYSEYYRMLELRPEDSNIRAALTELLTRRGELQDALEHARVLIELPATTDRARDLVLYGDVLACTGDSAGAAAAFSEALVLQPGYRDATYGLAFEAIRAGDLREAREHFETLRRAQAAPASNLYLRGGLGGDGFYERFRESGGRWKFGRERAETAVVWLLKHGRVEDAIRVIRAVPDWSLSPRFERGMTAAARLARSETS